MQGSFVYSNPTTLYFGEDALGHLAGELAKTGPNVVLAYGGGSIKRNGIYEQVTAFLNAAGKNVAEISGVMPNPTIEKVREGVQIARAHRADFLLAVGGGSVCDYVKALSASVNEPEDPWEKSFVRFEEPSHPVVPLGCILTLAGTGSEMNRGAVITNTATQEKVGKVFSDVRLSPRFAILNPRFTMSLPHEQMAAGIFDIFSHICEQYFSGTDDNTSDYLSEGLMRSVIHSSRIANRDPNNYEARSNIMWCAAWALNTLIGCGKAADWMVHMLGQGLGGLTNATHGMTLAAVSLPYYRYILPYGLPKFRRFAVRVWDVDPTGKSDLAVAEEGLAAMEAWMRELGLVMNITALGATPDMIDKLADVTILLQSGSYKPITREDVKAIFRASF